MMPEEIKIAIAQANYFSKYIIIYQGCLPAFVKKEAIFGFVLDTQEN